MGIDRSPSSVYAISHRPGYGDWLQRRASRLSEAMPAAVQVKIGHTSNLDKRLNSIAARGPARGDLRIEFEAHFATCREAKATERRLHARFTRKALGKEWFGLSAIDIKAIPAIVESFGCPVFSLGGVDITDTLLTRDRQWIDWMREHGGGDESIGQFLATFPAGGNFEY